MLQYAFMRNAFVASFLIALLCPLVGMHLVLRSYALMGDALAHGSLAGVSIAVSCGIHPGWGSFFFTALVGVLIEFLRAFFKNHHDLILSIVLSLSVGIAVTLLSSGLIQADIDSYLFGSILVVSTRDLWIMLALSVFCVGTLALRYHQLLYLAFDEETARICGVAADGINYVASVVISATIAASIKITGILVLSSLMTVPVATALQLRVGFLLTLVAAFLFSMLDTALGLVFSYYLNVAPGGFTALVSVVVLMLVIALTQVGRART